MHQTFFSVPPLSILISQTSNRLYNFKCSPRTPQLKVLAIVSEMLMSLILLFTFFECAEFEDYIPFTQNLTFAVVSNFSSCVSIFLVDDAVLENDEAFLLESVNTSLVTAIPPTVTISITNDDCELIINYI